MEDDNGLELSLGLACGRSSSPSRDRSDNSADGRPDTDERTSKILNDFRNFLNAGVPQSFQRASPAKPQENFFNNFQQTASGDNKRKSTFDGTENSKRQETDSYSSVLQEKEKNSHISITTDEGSTGDNEDVAESEVEGSTSRISLHRDDGSRTLGGSTSSSPAPKEIIDGKSSVSTNSLPVQTMNSSGVPYSITINEPPSASAPTTPVYPLSMQRISPITGGNLRPYATGTGSVPMTFTFSSVEIPDKDSSPWGMSRSQPLPSPYAGISTPTSDSDVGLPEQLRGSTNLLGEEGSSSQPNCEAGPRLNNSSFPYEYPAIKPGFAAQVKFGGSGSLPNLPWVSTTGPGPNGKTISGVTYKYNATQIKIVCACHGLHLSPEEFIRHANGDQPSAIPTAGLTSLQSTNPATTTSAKS
ncbi:hypothetical protein KSS87_022332 [Heliosperma pusillum]|nr:hypothetical protein KSS87_022332 [Heliosperma pusillum]